jgi:C-terminal processing protease CtpA/Prc
LVYCVYECLYRSFDPHTNYYSPKDKEDFDTQFTGKVIGIGALIQEKKETFILEPLPLELRHGNPSSFLKEIRS